MLCFCYFFRLLLDYLRNFFPVIFEQVASNMWIEIIRDFTLGHLGLMFLSTIMVVYFEIHEATFQTMAITTAVGGILCAYSPTIRCLVYLVCMEMVGGLGRRLMTLYFLYIIVSNIQELKKSNQAVPITSRSLHREGGGNNRFNAYNLVNPISSMYTEECQAILGNLKGFCEDFEKTKIMTFSIEFYNTKQMCLQLKRNRFNLTSLNDCKLDQLAVMRNQTFHESLFRVYSQARMYLNSTLQGTMWDKFIDLNASIKGSEQAITAIKQCLGIARYFAIAHGFITSFFYFWSYTHYLDFDNIYITYLFETVDSHRRTKNMKHVLPIKSFEKSAYVHPYTILMTRAEKTALYFTIGMLLYEVSIIYMLIAIMKMHATQVTDKEIVRNIQKMYSFVYEGSVAIFKGSDSIPNLEFINSFGAIYTTIFVLAIHQVYTTRFRAVICGMVYPQIEESRGVALYHQIIVKRQDLFNIRHLLLLDRLEHAEMEEERGGDYYLRFSWWKSLARWLDSVREKFELKVLTKIYICCTLCGDYEYFHIHKERFHKCPDENCELIYCSDCIAYLGKPCVKDDHEQSSSRESTPSVDIES